MADCEMWGTLLLSTTLLSVVLESGNCDSDICQCKKVCNEGSFTGTLTCIAQDCLGTKMFNTGTCNLDCSRETWELNCENGQSVDSMQLQCNRRHRQTSNAKRCNMICSGINCTQHCKEFSNVFKMYCSPSQYAQTCFATECHMTFGIVLKKCLKCSRSQCSTSDLYPPSVITSTVATAIQVIANKSSTLQGTGDSQADPPLQSWTPSSFASLPLLSSLSPSSTSSSLSFLSSLSATAALSPSTPSPLSSFSSPSITKTSPSSTLEVIQNLANYSVSRLNGIDAKRNGSLKEAMRVFEVFTDHFLNITKFHGGQPGNGGDGERRESIFKVAIAFEEFALKYGKLHLSGTKPSTNLTSPKMVMGIQRGYRQNATDFYLKKEEWQASINISSEEFSENGSVVVGCMYKDLHELLVRDQSTGDENGNSRYVNTRIITAAIDPKPEQLRRDAILKFRNLKVVDEEKHCMFWSGLKKSPHGFLKEGCHVYLSESNSEETVCSCNHLTHFAVLVDFSGSEKLTKKDVTLLEIITYVGLSLSIIGMLSTIILYSFLTDVRQPLSQIRLSLAVSLGAGQIIFLAGINTTANKAVCVTVAVLMQYFLMASFCWMLVEGIYLYLFVVKVYNINTKMHMYHCMSWGFPVVMVAISLSISAGKEGIQSYTSDKYCWMSSANSLIWIFVTFVITIEVVNILILIRVISEMTRMQPTGDKKIQQIRLGIRACVVMIPLLGVTWLFGLLSPLHKAFAYIFTILNSTQGFLIFSLHCARNSQIKERFNRKVNTVFPSVNKGNSTKKSSQINLSYVGDARVVELESYH